MSLSWATRPPRGIVFMEKDHQYGITAHVEPREIYHLYINPYKIKSSYKAVQIQIVNIAEQMYLPVE